QPRNPPCQGRPRHHGEQAHLGRSDPADGWWIAGRKAGADRRLSIIGPSHRLLSVRRHTEIEVGRLRQKGWLARYGALGIGDVEAEPTGPKLPIALQEEAIMDGRSVVGHIEHDAALRPAERAP